MEIYVYGRAKTEPEREAIATRDHMAARGPDGAGIWQSPERRVALGHRRLAILDLDPRSDQPMASECGRFAIVFNGEIYNFPELRRMLERDGRRFRTTSDTEALLHLYAIKGKEMVHDLRGMFAFGIWDNHEKTLFLARDPYGIKPLYFSDDGNTFRFASQVKALLAGGQISTAIEPAGVVGFHLWGSVPEPFTLYREIHALPAGHMQLVTSTGSQAPQQYESLASIFFSARDEVVSPAERGSRVREATRDSVGAHLLADVEVGVFLSAGVDSGALLGLMRDAGQARVRAITLAFEEFQNTSEDEAPLAATVAKQFGAEHIVRTVGREEFLADLPAILEAMDQPSIDGINTWFVSKAAKEAGLKVALSGLGGDEILAGYPSFRDIPAWTRWLSLPSAIPGLGRLARVAGRTTGLTNGNPKAAGLLEFGGTYTGAYMLRRGLFMPFELREAIRDRKLVDEGLAALSPDKRLKAFLNPDPITPSARIAVLESSQYMRNQLLRDTDWAGMAHSLEIRTPLADIHLARALASVTMNLEVGEGKRALANAPSAPLSRDITDRNKTGFGVPTRSWMAQVLGVDPLRASKGEVSRAWAHSVMDAFATAAVG